MTQLHHPECTCLDGGCAGPRALTADTITDEQIRELREAVPPWKLANTALHYDTSIALGYWDGQPGLVRGAKRKARARCAEILNARSVK